jgi:hypothetical protein
MAVLLGTFEQMKLDEARDLFEMRLSQTCSKSRSDPFLTLNRFMAMNMTHSFTCTHDGLNQG